MYSDRQTSLMDVVRRHDKTIWRLCMRHAWGDTDLAEDLEQEVVLRIWQTLDGLTAAPGTAGEKAWVVKVTRSVISNRMRKQCLPAETLREAMLVDETAGRQRDLLEELAAYLPGEDREILRLRMDGYSNGEIAGMLSVTVNSVNIRFSRMLAKMRAIYDKLYNNRTP